MKQYVIIVAGGKGLRMGSTIPKQFLEIKGKAIILHTLEKFKEALPLAELLLVLPETEISRWKKISQGTVFEELKIAQGGRTRFESVRAGLNLIQSQSVIGVHDAVRPFVTVKTIQKVFVAAEEFGAAIPVVDVKDSIRKIEGDNSKSVNRSKYRIVQTPQCFHSEVIINAYQKKFDDSFTDDASVVEANGIKVKLVEGNYSNIKITTSEDLKMGSLLLD